MAPGQEVVIGRLGGRDSVVVASNRGGVRKAVQVPNIGFVEESSARLDV